MKPINSTCTALFLFFSLAISSSVWSQSFTPGWSGSELIPLTDFTNLSKWNCNFNKNTGDTCYLSVNDSTLFLHWKFASGNRTKFAQVYQSVNPIISMAGKDIIGLNIKGSKCNYNRHFKFKLEDGKTHSTFQWEHMAKIERWCHKPAVLKSQFSHYQNFHWDSIKVVSFEVASPASAADMMPDSGVIAISNLVADSVIKWKRASSFEPNPKNSVNDGIAGKALQGILSRQDTNTGLFQTWKEDTVSYLYGQGILLKLLCSDTIWNSYKPREDSAMYAAEKLALFLANNQDKMGFWPRAWKANTGAIKIYLESDSTIWMGDFPWIITGLQNYFNKTGDVRVQLAIEKAKNFLYNLIEPNGQLFTINPYTGQKKEVSSTEAYAAAILGVFELGDSAKAQSMLSFIDQLTWDADLSYWHEAGSSSRTVLFANTWMASLNKNNPLKRQKALDALSFVGKVLYTNGPGAPAGFDGIGPIATWYEGTLSYICGGGGAAVTLFDSLVKYRYPDGTIPHYNDSVAVAGIWAVPWSSLDGSVWLCYAASGTSPFERHTSYRHADTEAKKVFIHAMGWFDETNSGRNWRDGHERTPLIGYYSSQSWPAQMYQALLSHSCGIDGMIMNVKDTYDAGSMRGMLHTIEWLKKIDSRNFNYDFAISYDDQGMDNVYPYDTAIATFRLFKDAVLPTTNSYLHYYHKPAIFIFNYNDKYLSASAYDSVFTSVFDKDKPFVAWNQIEMNSLAYTDASYPWVGVDNSGWYTNGLNWGKKYLEWYYPEVNRHTMQQQMVIGGVWPGFDDRSCSWGKNRWMDRQDGAVYDSTWGFVNKYQQSLPLKWAIIETWNDWNEGTEIEPSVEYRYKYLIETLKHINTFKGSSITTDTCKFDAALQIYKAARDIQTSQVDSVIYTPVLEKSIKHFLLNNCDSAKFYTSCIQSKCIITGVNHRMESESKFEIYPNPATGEVHIDLLTFVVNPKVSIYNSSGKKVFNKSFYGNQLIIDVNEFPAGMYLMKIITEDQVYNKRFLKK